MAKVITVFGASRKQGSSVSRALASDPNYTVRAVVPDPNSECASHLRSKGIDVVKGDLTDKEGLNRIVSGSYGCFVFTKTDVTRNDAMEVEIQQGKNIADACVFNKVNHVVFSTQLNTKRALGIVARHMVAKAEIEDYMRVNNIPLTGIIVPCYYENFMDIFKPIKISSSDYELAVPMGLSSWDIISVEDVGEVVRQIFTNRQQYIDKTLSLAGDKRSVREIAAILSRCLTPKRFKDKQITVNEYQYLGYPWCKDYAVMFDFFCRVDQKYHVNTTKGISAGVRSLEEWVRDHAMKLAEVLEKAPVRDDTLVEWT